METLLFYPHYEKMWDSQKQVLKKSIGSSKIVVNKTNNGGKKAMLYLDDIKSAPASSKASTTRSRLLNESATVTVMMTSSLP